MYTQLHSTQTQNTENRSTVFTMHRRHCNGNWKHTQKAALLMTTTEKRMMGNNKGVIDGGIRYKSTHTHTRTHTRTCTNRGIKDGIGWVELGNFRNALKDR